ncbi:MAG: transcription termination/antitermination protein NusA [Clostridiales bacterium]|nr:transcription termination/antitermination protein NusA [Clostridiales bacterium]
MVKVNKEFFLALQDLEKERGIPQQVFLDALKNALVSACKKQYSVGTGVVDIKLSPEKETIDFYIVKTVVEEVENEETEISLADAQAIKKSYKVGDTVSKKFVPKDFSRIAAQTAKQVILQKIHETERDAAMNEFSDKEGELLVGIVRKIDAKNVYIELGKGQVEGLMLPSDQVPGEKYNINDRIKVYVKRVKNGFRGAQVLVSRSAPGLVAKLFEEEVPEIKQGTVQIKGISREAGARTKIAIHSTDDRVDAIGSCVGNKGARVNAIVEELKGEKIDIIPWSENPLEFIAKALSPAPVLSVTQLDGDKNAMAVVPDDKLSLAIGKDGQNARLAVRLTNWKIDVKSKTAAEKLGVGVATENDGADKVE